MSLERKCLLLFGSVLLLTMCAAFWVVDLLAGRLVIDRTRQVALDAGAVNLFRVHVHEIYRTHIKSDSVFQACKSTVDAMGQKLLQPDTKAPPVEGQKDNSAGGSVQLRSGFEYSILKLDDSNTFANLNQGQVPKSEVERQILKELETSYRQRLATSLKSQPIDLIDRPIQLEENAPFTQISPSARPVFVERGPINGQYIHYRPVFWESNCLITCHATPGLKVDISDPEMHPFRVIRVSMPYRATHEALAWIRAVIIALGMLIIAVTLYVLHSIVRYLVLRPLHHLHAVSEAITHGDIDLRASIETEDEFRELADAFNRMLRHLVESQDQVQKVNRELDQRVDQLAQANLQLYEANRLKNDFMANMSHELRTPLNSIIGFSEVLQGIDSISDKQRRYASNIRKSGRVLLEMINDILDLAKVEAGKMKINPSSFSLDMLVRAQADMVRSLSEEKNIQLTVEIDKNLPNVDQDQNKLGQIITNLLSNAIKFTPDGGMIKVCVTHVDPKWFCVSVTDTGVGIAEEDQRIIFEKFRQSNQVLDGEGLTREYAGTGLGLSIVKELSKLLGGEVSFKSKLGQGSTFQVTLPRVLPATESSHPTKVAPVSRAALPTPNRSNKRES